MLQLGDIKVMYVWRHDLKRYSYDKPVEDICIEDIGRLARLYGATKSSSLIFFCDDDKKEYKLLKHRFGGCGVIIPDKKKEEVQNENV